MSEIFSETLEAFQWNVNMREVQRQDCFRKTVNFYNSYVYLFLARERPASTDMQRFARKKNCLRRANLRVFIYCSLPYGELVKNSFFFS